MFTIKHKLLFIICFGVMCMSYTTSKLLKDPNAPLNYTGAPKAVTPNLGQVRYCSNSGCHSDFSLNTAGGGVTATGLPTTTYLAGQTYNFSIRINHGSATMTNWGFAIKAVNTVDNDVVGTFSTTSSNASLKGTVAGKTAELSHSNAPSIAASSTYTFVNLKWTAPAVPTINQSNIRFYIVGVAGDSDGSEAGDYVYSTTVNASLSTLPVTLYSFNAIAQQNNTVCINWQTSQELNTAYFMIESSTNNSNWAELSPVDARGKGNTMQSYTVTDKKPAAYNSNIYYRLKMVDKDGSYTYSPVQMVRLKNNHLIIDQVSAQPLKAGSNGIFTIHASAKRTMMIAAFDGSGRMIYNNSVVLTEGANTIEIPGTKLSKSSGTVYIRFISDGFEKTFTQLIE